MPELPDIRIRYENRLDELLWASSERLRKEVIRAMGDPPDPKRIPPDLWLRLEREHADTLAALLAMLYLESWNSLSSKFGVIIQSHLRFDRRTGPRAMADRFGLERSEFLAQKRLQRLQRTISDAAAAPIIPGEPIDWEKVCRDNWSRGLNRAVATTVTTNGITNGEFGYLDAIEPLLHNRLDLRTGQPATHVLAPVVPARGPLFPPLDLPSVFPVLPTEAPPGGGGASRIAPPGGAGGRGAPRIIRLWYTERDAKVCPICRPLHRQTREKWEPVSPGGPPAHFNCRCWLTYRIASPPPGWPAFEIV